MVAASIRDIVHLAIETTGRTGSIAVLRGQEVLQWCNLDPNRRTAASLAPQINMTIDRCRHQGCPVSMVSIADGPGSFTGLRIGVTTAKTLSYALGLPLVAVDSLAGIAAAAFDCDADVQSICVGIDAYRGQVYSGTFHRIELMPGFDQIPDNWSPYPAGTEVLTSEQWDDRLKSLAAGTGLVGDKKAFASRAESRIERRCDAIGVGLLAIRAFSLGQTTDPLALVPRYLKASAAEENLR